MRHRLAFRSPLGLRLAACVVACLVAAGCATRSAQDAPVGERVGSEPPSRGVVVLASAPPPLDEAPAATLAAPAFSDVSPFFDTTMQRIDEERWAADPETRRARIERAVLLLFAAWRAETADAPPPRWELSRIPAAMPASP